LPEGYFIPSVTDAAPRIILRKIKPGEGISAVRRRNFTLAHEIGHFIIRRDVAECIKNLGVDDVEEETLCNAFAAELLMPGFCLHPDLKKNRITPRALLDLSDRYEVSLQALLSQVVRIFRGTVVAFLWAQGGRGRPVPSWSGPPQFRRAILCDSGSTPIEKAFCSSQTESGRCEVLLDGRRSRWNALALRLPDSKKVLSVLFRSEKQMRGYLPTRCRSSAFRVGPQLTMLFPRSGIRVC
jgi:hypothetical protein